MENVKWNIDQSNSEISFTVRKLLITTVKGNFQNFKGTLETEEDNFSLLKNINFKAKIDSIKTDDETRDIHLRSADFFDMETYPYFTFTAGQFNVNEKKLEGELSIKNITKKLSLDVEYESIAGKERSAKNLKLIMSGKVNRQDFGLSWNGKNEAGEIIVGDQINLKANISFIKKPALSMQI